MHLWLLIWYESLGFEILTWFYFCKVFKVSTSQDNKTKWLMSCVTSANFTVLINGETSPFFHSGRGMRQGCPLSLLLFLLIMEGLSLQLKKGQVEGKLTGVKASRIDWKSTGQSRLFTMLTYKNLPWNFTKKSSLTIL